MIFSAIYLVVRVGRIWSVDVLRQCQRVGLLDTLRYTRWSRHNSCRPARYITVHTLVPSQFMSACSIHYGTHVGPVTIHVGLLDTLRYTRWCRHNSCRPARYITVHTLVPSQFMSACSIHYGTHVGPVTIHVGLLDTLRYTRWSRHNSCRPARYITVHTLVPSQFMSACSIHYGTHVGAVTIHVGLLDTLRYTRWSRHNSCRPARYITVHTLVPSQFMSACSIHYGTHVGPVTIHVGLLDTLRYTRWCRHNSCRPARYITVHTLVPSQFMSACSIHYGTHVGAVTIHVRTIQSLVSLGYSLCF